MIASQLADSFQVPGKRRHTAHVSDYRFDYHCRDTRVFGENLFESLSIVEGKCDCVFRQGCWNTWTVGQPECGDARTGFDQQTVSVAVIATLELHQPRASGDT